VRNVDVYTVSDVPETRRGVVRWEVFHLDGRSLLTGAKRVALNYGKSVKQHTLDMAKLMQAHGRENLVIRISLEVNGEIVSQDGVLLTPPRFANLPKAETKFAVRELRANEFQVTFKSKGYQHRLWFDLEGIEFTASDNCFDLFAGETKVVTIKGPRLTKATLERKLRCMSVVDTY
jgi:beta-mannosidase